MLTAPLRDRFGVVNRMEYYTIEELKTIVLRSAKVLGVGIDERGADALARRSRGTPRLANRLLKRVRDFAQVKYDGYITEEVSIMPWIFLTWIEGLDRTDRDLSSYGHRNSEAVRWDLIHCRHQSAKMRGPLKMCMSPICLRMVLSSGRREAVL